MSCEDIPSLLDLQKVKKHADDFGRLMGTGTGTSTNEVTGQVRPTYNKVINDMNSEFDGMISDMNSEFDTNILNMGFTRIGTFSAGATITNPRQTLLWDVADGGDGQEYGWSGSFLPSGKVVPPGSTPLTTGGIAVGAWMSRFDPELRTQVLEALRRSYAEAGYNLVDGSFEAGGTLVNANDALLQERTGKAFSGPAGTVAAGTYPTSGGFVDRSDALLRTEFLRRDGDVRGWGAKLDGVTYDDAAFAAAIAETGGRITLRGHARLSTNAVFNGLTEPCVTFDVGGKISIDTSFSFHPSYRGILTFKNCHNPKVVEPVIVGARVDKLSAIEPWEDGDSGVEYINCTGVCRTIDPVLSDFKAWGVIHVNVEGYLVTNPTISKCLVQSGVGGTGVKHGSITNPDMEWIGLYGIEIESSVQNKLISVNGGRISRALKAIAIVGNSDDVSVSDVIADRCLTGFNVATASANRSFVSGTSHNCLHDIELVSATNANVNVRQTTDGATIEFIRSRSYDFFMKVVGDVGYVLDRQGQPASISVGKILLLESDVQKTVTEVIGTEIDPVMGQVVKIRTSPALVAEDARKMFLRNTNIGTSGRYLVMYDGANNTVKGGSISKRAGGIDSFGSHENFVWDDVTIREVDAMFNIGSTGTVSGRIAIDNSDVISLASLGSTAKFAPAFSKTKTFQVTTTTLTKAHSLHIPGGTIGKISAVLNDDVTASGTIVLRLGGIDTLTFTGGAKKASAFINTAVSPTTEAIKVSLADTVGNLSGSGYSVTVYGVFTK